jgi:putative CocE/NonD family hydrolase
MKGIQNGIMQEPPIKLFVMNTDDWKEAHDWPLPETKFTPFYLHEKGLLWEHEYRRNEGSSSFEDSLRARGSLEFTTPEFVEKTEVIGPIALKLYASTSSDDVLWFVSLREIDAQGNKRLISRGWLRGSHREIDAARSKPWQPFHPHTKAEPLTPEQIYEFDIELRPTANLFRRGSRLELKISCKDDPPKHALEGVGVGHIRRQASSRITVFHNEDYPSQLLLPITRGNVLGMFIQGARPYQF